MSMDSLRLQKLLQQKMTRREFLALTAMAAASAAGITGLIRELESHASTPTASLEPENGTKSGVATLNDATASGGQAVKFQASGGGGTSGALPFWGCAHIGNTVPTAIESAAGRPVGVHRIYFDGDQVSQGVAMASSDVSAHRVPWISFKLPHTWTQAAAGADDGWAQDLCAQLGALNGPVLLTFHHEPEGDETPLTDFVAMHDRLYQFSKPYANIKCGPILTGYDWISGEYDLNTYWPGAFKSGDFIAFDAYCSYLAGQTGKWFFLGDQYLKTLAAFAKSKGVQWGIGEFGLSAGAAAYNRAITGGNANGTSGGDVSWIREVYSTAVSLGGCLALSYFDSGLNSKNNVASQYTPSNLVGQPAWPLETLTYSGTTYLADAGTPSKLSVFTDVLKQTPAWRSGW